MPSPADNSLPGGFPLAQPSGEDVQPSSGPGHDVILVPLDESLLGPVTRPLSPRV